MNVDGLHKKADLSMCTVKAKHWLQGKHVFFFKKIKFLGSLAVVLVKIFPLMY